MTYATLVAERDARLETLNETNPRSAKFETVRKAYWDASDAVTDYRPTKGDEEIVRQEGQHMTRLRAHFVNCPFRGFPYTPKIDERCPTIIEVTTLPLEVTSGAVRETIGQTIPHVTPGSTCDTCLVKQIREKEDGMAVSVYTKKPDKSSKLHGTRRRTRKAG